MLMKVSRARIFLTTLICVFCISFSVIFIFSVYAKALNTKPLTVDVFTLTKWPLPNKQHSFSMITLPSNAIVNIYQIDKISQLNKKLNQVGVRSFKTCGKEAAIATAQKWIKAHKVAYQRALKGVSKSLQFQIKQIPAIVFDNQYVVLGTLNLNKAYQEYLNYKRKIAAKSRSIV
jgi:integrating conjugative element protein (TIGR03757 family)